jgi:hypothetical protein
MSELTTDAPSPAQANAYEFLGSPMLIAADPKAAAKRFAVFESRQAEIERAQAKLEADRAKHVEAVAAFAKEHARIAKLGADLKKAEGKVGRLTSLINERTTSDFLTRRPALRQCTVHVEGAEGSTLSQTFCGEDA